MSSGSSGDVMVAHGDVQLATTDLGGSGPSIVLMHGLGGSRRTMAKVAARLQGWRVISMDLRGHGLSTTAPWDFPAAVADLEAVVGHYELENPYVAGHSLGGMVALQYALAGRPTAGAVNIDGWGPGAEGRFPGQDPVRVRECLDRIAEGRLTWAGRLLTAVARQTREGTTLQVMRLLRDADVVAWHRDAPCPSLAINATAPSGRALKWVMGSETVSMQRSHRQGLHRDLTALAQQDPLVRLVEVEATHGLITTHPAAVASAISEFHAALTV